MTEPDAAHQSAQVARLRREPLLDGCTPTQLARLLGQLEAVRFAAGEVLQQQGAPATALLLIEDGEIALASHGGAPSAPLAPLAPLAPSELIAPSAHLAPLAPSPPLARFAPLSPRCGEEAAGAQAVYLCEAVALTPVRALRLPREALAGLAQEQPAFAQAAVMALAAQLSRDPRLLAPARAQPADAAAPAPAPRRAVK